MQRVKSSNIIFKLLSFSVNNQHLTLLCIIPLQFWYCRNPGLALPLIALQYHEVKVWLEFNELRNLMWTNNAAVSSAVAAALSLALGSGGACGMSKQER